MKKYKTYKSTGIDWIGEIPDHWSITKIKKLFVEKVEKNHETEQLLAATQAFGVIPKEEYTISKTVIPVKDLHLLKLVECGNFVISLRSFQGGIEHSYHRGIISPAYTILELSDKQDTEYYKHLFKSKSFIQHLASLVTGIREGQNINTLKFFYSYIIKPPKEEQVQISTFLNKSILKLDKVISNKKSQIGLLLELNKTYMNFLTIKTGGESGINTKFDWYGNIPKTWNLTKIKSLFQVVTGSTPKSSVEKYWGGEIDWVTPEDLGQDLRVIISSKRKITEEGYDSCGTTYVEKDSIILATRAPIGNITLVGKKMCFNQGCKALEKRREINTHYFYYLLKSIEEVIESKGRGTTFIELPTKELANFKVVCPPIEEQSQIVLQIDNIVTTIRQSIKKIENEIILLEEYKSVLVDNVVTGKIKVTD